MAKKRNQEQSVKASEEFIRRVLAENFHQEVKPDALRLAAEKLSSSLPNKENKKEVA